jgi:hypothetical protein
VLSKLWEYMLEGEYPTETLTELSKLMGGETAFDGARIFSALIDEFNLEYPHISEALLDSFTSKVNPSKLNTNPVPLDTAAIKEIYKRTLCDGI